MTIRPRRGGGARCPACPATMPRRPRSVAGEGTRLRRVLLRWQAPQPCRSRPGAAIAEAVDPDADPYADL